MPGAGLEPARLFGAAAFKAAVSAIPPPGPGANVIHRSEPGPRAGHRAAQRGPGEAPSRHSPEWPAWTNSSRGACSWPSEITSRLSRNASVQSATHPDLAVERRDPAHVVRPVHQPGGHALELDAVDLGHALVQAEAGDAARRTCGLYSFGAPPRTTWRMLSASTAACRTACCALGEQYAPGLARSGTWAQSPALHAPSSTRSPSTICRLGQAGDVPAGAARQVGACPASATA